MANVLMTGKLVTDRTQVTEVLVDGAGSLISITHAHSKVHQGKFFSVGYLDDAVVTTASIAVLLQIPASVDVHTYIKLIAGADARLDVYEGPTFSAAGTALTPVNHNRASSNTSVVTATHSPTITGPGTLLWSEYIPGGSAGQTPGAVQDVTTEQVILAPSEDYLFYLTNLGSNTEPLQITLAFYEV